MDQRGGESSNGDTQPPDHPWTGHIRFSEPHEGPPVAYRHNEVITTGREEALAIARRLAPDVRIEDRLGPFIRLVGMPDPMQLVRELRAQGLMAQPNHTHFHHALTANPVTAAPVHGTPVHGTPVHGTPVYGSPVYGSPVYGSPVYAGPVHGTPVHGTPVHGTPIHGTPVHGTPVHGTPVHGTPVHGTHTHQMWSSACPAPSSRVTTAIADRLHSPASEHSIRVLVLDTGLAAKDFRPEALPARTVTAATPADVDVPDDNHDGALDPAAGHGTFISGIIGQIAPGCQITVHRVLSNLGDGQEWDIAKCIHGLPRDGMKRTIVNMSFGGYTLEQAHVMEWAIREILATGAVIVASAGNDATCRPTYPAALHGVLGVGALDANGPASFTNYGPWVDVCAPGVDLLSTFFTNFDGVFPGPDGANVTDGYRGWAFWSGTSFAAPVVVGNLARMMMLGAPTARDAVTRLLESPAGMSIPNLGRIVNDL